MRRWGPDYIQMQNEVELLGGKFGGPFTLVLDYFPVGDFDAFSILFQNDSGRILNVEINGSNRWDPPAGVYGWADITASSPSVDPGESGWFYDSFSHTLAHPDIKFIRIYMRNASSGTTGKPIPAGKILYWIKGVYA